MNKYIAIVSFLVCTVQITSGGPFQDRDRRGTSQNGGSVVLSFQRSELPSIVRVLTATLERSGYPSIAKSMSVQGSLEEIELQFGRVPSGTWTAIVQWKNKSGNILYSGTSTVSVVNFQVVRGAVSLTPAVMNITWGLEHYKWKMPVNNPVLMQSDDEWDAEHYYLDDPVVLKLNGVYHMWYSSAPNERGNEDFFIAYATSADGIKWAKHGPVISPVNESDWMTKGADSPCVMYDDGMFKMWFVGQMNPARYRSGIGYATSKDGKNWDVAPQPVVPIGSSLGSPWHPSVVKHEGLYYLYLGASSSPAFFPRDIVLMTSTDGIHWSNRGTVFSAPLDGSWRSRAIIPCEVIYDENRFKMFYTGFRGEGFSIGCAESREGINWTIADDLPVLTSKDVIPWSVSSVGFPAVLRDDGKLKVWFSALTKTPPRYQIGYAEQIR